MAFLAALRRARRVNGKKKTMTWKMRCRERKQD